MNQKARQQRTQSSGKQNELLLMEEDDEENFYTRDVAKIQQHLQTMRTLIARLAPLVATLGTPEGTPKIRASFLKWKNEGLTLAKTIHRLLIGLDSYNPNQMATVDPQATRKRLDAKFKRLLSRLQQVFAQAKDIESSSSQSRVSEEEEQEQEEQQAILELDPKLKLVSREELEKREDEDEERQIDDIESLTQDILEIMPALKDTVVKQNEQVAQVVENIDDASTKVDLGKRELKKAAATAAVGTAILGATIGAVVLGPVGGLIGGAVATSLSLGVGAGVGAGLLTGGTLGATVSYFIGKKAAKKAAELPPEEKRASTSIKK